MMRRIFLILITIYFFGMTACKKNVTPPTLRVAGKNVLDIIQNSYTLSFFKDALNYTGLTDSLKGSGPFTLFIPDNFAFDSSGFFRENQLLSMGKDSLRRLLMYHIIKGQTVTFNTVASKPDNVFFNIEGSPLFLSREIPPTPGRPLQVPDFLAVNGFVVKHADVLAANGVIHILSNVLKYPANNLQTSIQNDTSLSFFEQALKQFNLWNVLVGPGPFTVFAPVNGAFRGMGIGLDSLKKLDTLHFFKLLFNPYVLNQQRIFTTDGFDFYSYDNTFTYTGNTNTYQVVLNTPYANSSPSIPFYTLPVSVTTQAIDTLTADLYYLRNVDGFTPPISKIIDKNRISKNGVLQIIDSLMVTPQYVKK